MELKNKTVVITGASTGIGRELAILLAKEGASLALLARNESNLKNTESEVKRIHPEVLAIPFDVQDGENAGALMNKLQQRFGSIDILINNAGVGLYGPLEKMKISDLDRVVKTNVYGLLHMTRAALPFLKKSKGMVVNISSALSKRALPFLSAYAGTKSMVDALSDGMRLEFREYGIKVLNYCPPGVDNGFAEHAIRVEGMDPRRRERRGATSEEIARDIVKAVRKEKREVVKSRFLKIANFYAPRFLDGVFYKNMVQRESVQKLLKA
jgi:short-subunit dehydrogenase